MVTNLPVYMPLFMVLIVGVIFYVLMRFVKGRKKIYFSESEYVLRKDMQKIPENKISGHDFGSGNTVIMRSRSGTYLEICSESDIAWHRDPGKIFEGKKTPGIKVFTVRSEQVVNI